MCTPRDPCRPGVSGRLHVLGSRCRHCSDATSLESAADLRREEEAEESPGHGPSRFKIQGVSGKPGKPVTRATAPVSVPQTSLHTPHTQPLRSGTREPGSGFKSRSIPPSSCSLGKMVKSQRLQNAPRQSGTDYQTKLDGRED